MTITNSISTAPAPALSLRYTLEELAVLADLYELVSLPGVHPVELSEARRNLATRTLLARHVMQQREDGAIEICQPHATFLAAMFEAPSVVQVAQSAGDHILETTWFDWGNECVSVKEDEDGIVTLAAYAAGARDTSRSLLGIADVVDADGTVEAESVVDLVYTTRTGDEYTVDRVVLARAGTQWFNVPVTE